MEYLPPSLTTGQWEFLAILYKLDSPISLEVLSKMSPLIPSDFMEIQDLALNNQWIHKTKNNFFSIALTLPKILKDKLKSIEISEKINLVISNTEIPTISNPQDMVTISKYLRNKNLLQSAAQIESNLARYYLSSGNYNEAMIYFDKTISTLSYIKSHLNNDNMYTENVIKLLNLTFALGKGFDKLPHLIEITKKAILCTKINGNKRLLALAHLHLGRLQLFSELRDEALHNLSIGRKEIEELGDKDSLYQACEFIGLYYYLQGDFLTAIEYFEQANRALGSGYKEVIDPCSCALLGFSASYLGQLSLAIGILDYNWRLAANKGNPTAACTIRATLGTVLILIGKNREGYYHLKEVVEEATETQNNLALYFGRAGLALYYYTEKDLEKAYSYMSLNLCKGIDSGKGMLNLVSSPWVLEMIYEAMKEGIPIQIPGFDLKSELNRIINTPNIHMKGVALRIRAQLAYDKGEHPKRILDILDESERLLARSGNMVQLAKTRVEKVRLNLRLGHIEQARELAVRTRKGLSGASEDSFPDDLRYLLEGYDLNMEKVSTYQPNLKLFMDMMDEMMPSPEMESILTRMVGATNRLFGGERGGLFWYGKNMRKPTLRVGRNMTELDVHKDDFAPNLALINQSHKTGASLVKVFHKNDKDFKKTQSVLCLPLKTQNKGRWVLYHDNSYMEGCFKQYDETQLNRLSNHLAVFIERLSDHEEKRNKNKALALSYNHSAPNKIESKIIFKSPAMEKLLAQADRVAKTDASVLILGETGVGKGMLATRLHEQGARKGKPLVVVDMTTIPENLIESELFGYEKGAFTGAERQKIGRLELANGGTLFIDEIGEIPQAIQAKLLRVLQEGCFVRIGGTRTLTSNFRLIVATNRNLTEEINNGTFRSDLYYRINTITLTLPPLRERKKDIFPLAQHFFGHYVNKHKRYQLKIGALEKKLLETYHWPGNVRELKNTMESSVLLSNDEKLELNLSIKSNLNLRKKFAEKPTLDELQKQYIEFVLNETKGQISGPNGAAEILGMKRTTLNARMTKLKISPSDFR